MGCFNSNKNNNNNNKPRTIYIDLLSDDFQIIQTDNFCSNEIKTTTYTMYIKYF